jgi:hypothetical protein
VTTNELTGVDLHASVVGASEIEIAAAPDAVWDVLTGFERWPSWNPDVKSDVDEEGRRRELRVRLEVGAWNDPIDDPACRTAASDCLDGEDGRHRAIHFWLLESRSSGTFVRTEESYDGIVARLCRRSLKRTIDGALENGLAT